LLLVIITTAGLRGWLDDWAPLAEWLVAGGTILLALGTFRLAKQATREAQAVTEDARQVANQVTLQREQMERGGRAYVYPSTPSGWAVGAAEWQDRRLTVLPIKNGGPGLALNVEGKMYWRNPGEGVSWRTLTIYGGSVAPMDSVDARVSQNVQWGWQEGKGYLRYTDLSGSLWLTEFEYTLGEGGQLVGKHSPPEQIEDDGVIGQRYPPRA